MAKAEQIKSLIQSHLENDRERFLTIAMQVAAQVMMIAEPMAEHLVKHCTGIVPILAEIACKFLQRSPDLSECGADVERLTH